MKIVILDGYTLNPGDLKWDGLKQLGNVVIYDRTPANKVIERAEDAEIVFTNKTLIEEEALDNLPSLKYIGVLATGYNVVNTQVAKQKKIIVTNVPDYGTPSVVQLTFALLLELCQHVQRHSDSVMNDKWSRSDDFSFCDYPLTELANKTIGIIGFGNIGSKVGDIATGFGMNIMGNSRRKTNQSHRNNFRWAEVPELLEQSDVGKALEMVKIKLR